MKLLKKSALANELAQQRQAQIDEGIAIARKVDTLRQTLASLEKQHSDFLNGMQSELEKRSRYLLNEIATREKILIEIEERRQKLLIPLDAEWEKLNQEKSKLATDKDLIAKGLLKIQEKQKLTDEKYQESKKTLARINVRERELVKVYDKAEENSKEIETIKKNCLKDKERLDQYIKEQTQSLLEREAEIAVRERENQIKSDKLEIKEKEIIKTKAQLEDQRKTLERALARKK